jgi:AraC-like DNA-binding protein
MYYYVNHQAINEFLKPIEVENDPVIRIQLIDNLQEELINRLVIHAARTFFELKNKGWSTGQIAEQSGYSERKVKELIRWHAEQTDQHNPLSRHRASSVVDISYLVARKSVGSASPQTPTQEQP